MNEKELTEDSVATSENNAVVSGDILARLSDAHLEAAQGCVGSSIYMDATHAINDLLYHLKMFTCYSNGVYGKARLRAMDKGEIPPKLHKTFEKMYEHQCKCEDLIKKYENH